MAPSGPRLAAVPTAGSVPGPTAVVPEPAGEVVCVSCSAEWNTRSVVGPLPQALAGAAPPAFVEARRLYTTAARNVRLRNWRELRHPPCGWAITQWFNSRFEPGRGVVLDEEGRVRVYLEEGAGEESLGHARIFYDEAGRTRFVFVQHLTMYFGDWETLYAFQETGEMVVLGEREGLSASDRVAPWTDVARPTELLRDTCASPCPVCAEGPQQRSVR